MTHVISLLRCISIAFASAVLLHLAVWMLVGSRSWRDTFRVLFPGFFFLILLGEIVSLDGVAHAAFLGARLAAAMALVGITYGISFARVCGTWILATAMAGALIVPAFIVKIGWDGYTAIHSKREARQALGGQEAAAALLLREQALKAIRDRRFADAERTLQQAVQLQLLTTGKDIGLASTYYTMGDFYIQRREWMKAEGAYRQALSIAQEVLPDKSTELANYYNGLGVSLYNQKRVFEAESLHRKALDLVEPEQKKLPSTYKLILTNYARDLHMLSHHEQALELEKKAARISG